MNLLIVNYEYPPLGGGGGVATELLAKELAKNHFVYILTSHAQGLPRREVNGNLIIHRIPVLFRKGKYTATLASMIVFPFIGYFYAIYLLPKKTIDLIHSIFVVPSGLLGTMLANTYRVKHIITIIGGDIYDPSKQLSPHRFRLLRTIIKRLLERANTITAISTDVASRCAKIYGIQNTINILPISFDSKKTKTIKQSKKNTYSLITVARLVKRKNLDILIRSLKLLPEHVRLTIAGDGPDKSRLVALAQNLKINNRVTFTGYISQTEKHSRLANSDCFVLVSQHEGFGIVYLEAMSHGLPVIASRTGGQNDFLIHGKTGYLVGKTTAREIANTISKLMKHQTHAHSMSTFNKRVSNRFTPAPVTRKYEKLYEHIIR